MDAAEVKQSRRLIHIPIVHSQEDMGSSSDSVREAYIEQKGLEAWEESRLAIGKFWKNLEGKIAALDLDFNRVRLYQDGLPVCGFEAKIVRDLASTSTGSGNYRILSELIDCGAMLEGTEDIELLLKERQILKTWRADPPVVTITAASHERSVSVMRELLDQRDQYIAKRIDATLQPGEIGILFLGELHEAIGKLSSTIQVVSLDEFVSGCGAGASMGDIPTH